MNNEIRIKKEVMPELINGVEETNLGFKKGSKKQYRYGDGIHIREYDEFFTLHIDKYDPRKEPLKHLLSDTPELVISTGIGGLVASRQKGLLAAFLTFIVTSFLSYRLFNFIKKLFEK
ncbi:MAG: hypothetical protein QXX95_01205 [Nitrososphaerales archaeon]